MGPGLTRRQLGEIRMLQKKASARREQGLFVVEGLRMVREAPKDDVVKLVLSESMAAKPGMAQEFPDADVISDDSFCKISDTVSPQGILAVVRQREHAMDSLLSGDKALFLEGIQDPGNVGTILRTAEAAGVSGLFMDRLTADIYSPKVVRSTMGSIFRVPFMVSDDLKKTLCDVKRAGFTAYAAHLGGRSLYELEMKSPRAFLIGNEGSGLTDELAALADERVYIPMQGRVESLNAAVAAAILMYR